MKKCIFYLPYKLDEQGMGARMLRPRKMIKAFEDIGYDVFVITGVSSSRRVLIKELKQKIKSGEKYDFMYTESHTEPTLLTNPNHLPTHPFLDFSFFHYIRSCGIPIGLFYCDIYWKFEAYGAELSILKKQAALLCYRYDIHQYKKYLNRFYVPDMKICSYLNEEKLTAIAGELPPGADPIEVSGQLTDQHRDFDKKPLTLFYVGGIGFQYQIVDLIKAIRKTEKTRMTLCCREKEWEKEKDTYEPYMCDRIQVIHKTSNELTPYYLEADICSLLFKKDVYRELAKPFKAYEYLANEKPVLSTIGTAIGRFVEENDIGWNIEFNADTIAEALKSIIKDPSILDKKRRNCAETKKKNLWTSRAEQVVQDLHGSNA
ncbi:MAG: glycosyltransferase [Clostridia bacterium]|nr:glycosyltransferase [Clostridia bacterium]